MQQVGRSYSAVSGYRYGFNGKEKSQEITSDDYDFEARIYDGRIGKFLSLDPFIKKYPFFTPYIYAGNNPVVFIDNNGDELRLNGASKTERDAFKTILQTAFGDKIIVDVSDQGVVTLKGSAEGLEEKSKALYDALNTVIKDDQVTRLFVVKENQRALVAVGKFRAAKAKLGENVKSSNAVDLQDMKDLNGVYGVFTAQGLLIHEIWETYQDQKTAQAGDETTEFEDPHTDGKRIQSLVDGVTWGTSASTIELKQTGNGWAFYNYTTKDGKEKFIIVNFVNNNPAGTRTGEGTIILNKETNEPEVIPQKEKPAETPKTQPPAKTKGKPAQKPKSPPKKKQG